MKNENTFLCFTTTCLLSYASEQTFAFTDMFHVTQNNTCLRPSPTEQIYKVNDSWDIVEMVTCQSDLYYHTKWRKTGLERNYCSCVQYTTLLLIQSQHCTCWAHAIETKWVWCMHDIASYIYLKYSFKHYRFHPFSTTFTKVQKRKKTFVKV